MDAVEVVDAYASAWSRGEPEVAFAFFADEVVMRLPGRSALAGVHAGREAVIVAINALRARTDGLPVEVEVLDRLVSDQRVALLLREVVTRGDERLELRRINAYRVREDRLVAIDIFEADQYAVDEFFG